MYRIYMYRAPGTYSYFLADISDPPPTTALSKFLSILNMYATWLSFSTKWADSAHKTLYTP